MNDLLINAFILQGNNFGFVEFYDHKSAEYALNSLNDREIFGKVVISSLFHCRISALSSSAAFPSRPSTLRGDSTHPLPLGPRRRRAPGSRCLWAT